jgi:AAA+ superfamily predicted ATPase
VLRDAHMWGTLFQSDPTLAALFKELICTASGRGNCVILLGPEFKLWSAIEKHITVVEYDLPDQESIRTIASEVVKENELKTKAGDDVIKACSGLSTTEILNALSLSVIETKTPQKSGVFDPVIIYREKVAAVKRSGLLEIVDPDPRGLDAIGGLENLKEWVLLRKKAYSPEAEKYGLPAPKGCLLVGVPGSGKSLSAKAIGTALGVPSLKLDVGALFNSLVGESESRTRDALKLAEAMSPCVLWVDEVDKGLSGAQGSGSNDSGVTRRVFGTILSWMQDHKKPVFVVMTANQVDFLPPEFLRRGRFDELFAVDLPTSSEREQIAAVVIRKLKRDPKNFNLKLIAGATGNFTGAEIEAAIANEAMTIAFNDGGREFTTEDICRATGSIIPIAKTMAEKIEAIRRWADGRARPAGKPEQQQSAATLGRKISKE